MSLPLDAVVAVAEEAGAPDLAQEARALAERVAEGRFFVACLGQFKRGKSTLMNALVGARVVPTGVAPVTSVVTVLRFGPPRARVRLADEPWREVDPSSLGEYVSEEANPENVKRVTAVERFVPSPLLEGGLCLVDTPGVGSVFAGNTAEVRAFVPHIDAALVVLGGDPPISGEELALIESAAAQVRDVLFVLNKVDRLSDEERREARRFTEAVLASRLPALPRRVFEVSAAERLAGTGPARDWGPLRSALEGLAREGAPALVARAAERGLSLLTARLRRRLTEDRDALVRPAAESARRVEALQRCADDALRATAGLRHLFDAEVEALRRRFDEARARFEEAALRRVESDLDARLADLPGPRTGWRARALAAAQETTEREVRAWLQLQRPELERAFAEAIERLVGHANDFLGQLERNGQLPPGGAPTPVAGGARLRPPGHFAFAPLNRLADPRWWVALGDGLRAPDAARARARRAAVDFARHLLEVNASRAVSELDEDVTESRRGVERSLRDTLTETVLVARDAAARAQETQRQGTDAVARAVARLDALLAQLAALADAPADGPAPAAEARR